MRWSRVFGIGERDFGVEGAGTRSCGVVGSAPSA